MFLVSIFFRDEKEVFEVLKWSGGWKGYAGLEDMGVWYVLVCFVFCKMLFFIV